VSPAAAGASGIDKAAAMTAARRIEISLAPFAPAVRRRMLQTFNARERAL
jgi:hypothetical protein